MATKSGMEKLLGAVELSEVLGTTVDVVNSLTLTGEIRSYRLEGSARYFFRKPSMICGSTEGAMGRMSDSAIKVIKECYGILRYELGFDGKKKSFTQTRPNKNGKKHEIQNHRH